MQQFIEKYKDQVTGMLTGFDRLVFRGALGGLSYGRKDTNLKAVIAVGMEQYLCQNKILFKDYAAHVKRISERLKTMSLKPFREQRLPVEFDRRCEDKEKWARQIAAEKKIDSGLVCALSTLEPSPTFEHCRTHMIRRMRPCGALYQYQIHAEVGWMYARIQTWFPFNIQIGLNGREWLAQQMNKEGMKYRQQGNCFVWIEDYDHARALMKRQLETNWRELLESFARQLNPIQEAIFEQYPCDYYWTAYQTEWATDMVFKDGDYLRRLMSNLVRHGLLSYRSRDVLRFFGKKVNQSGQIPGWFQGELKTDLKSYHEGERVKYSMDGNLAKFYDKAYSEYGNVLRAAETTINNPTVFRTYRPKEGGEETDLKWRQMRKGVADVHRRAEVSQKTNERLIDALASVDDSRTVEELTDAMQKPVTWKGRRVRALRPWAEDKALLAAIGQGDFMINGFRNRDLQALFYHQPAETDAERRRRSAAVSRKLRMLRAHGLIHKVTRTHRYMVASEARTVLVAVLTTARTTINQINQLEAKAA
jgi:hypothetical protein